MAGDLVEQLRAERLTGIGGSDAGHLLSTPPWGCVRRLHYEKRDVPADFPETDRRQQRYMRRGHMLEPVAAMLYAEATGRRLARAGIRRHKLAPELLVHQDRQIITLADRPQAGRGVLEIKVNSIGAFRKYATEGLPPAYILQLQYALMVTEARWGAFALFTPDEFEVMHWDVDRDDALCLALYEHGRRVWQEIQAGELPAPLEDPADPRCARCPWRRTCRGAAVVEIDGRGRHVDVVQLDNLQPLVTDYLEAREYRLSAEELEEAIGQMLRGALGEQELAMVGNHRIHFGYAKDSLTLDEKAIQTAKPKFVAWLYDRFGKVRRGGRRLRVY